MIKYRIDHYLQFVMSLIGGFLGAYALLNHHDLFASAQTSNLIYLIVTIIGKNFGEFLFRLFIFASYIGGLICAVIIAKSSKLNLQLCSIIFDMAAVIVVCMISNDMNDFIALSPIFFVTAFQWHTFNGVDGYVSSSIFSTNNLKQFTTSLVEYLFDKNAAHLNKAKYYGSVLLFYHIGVAISYLSYLFFKAKGLGLCLVPLAVSLLLILIKNNKVSFANPKIHNWNLNG